MATEKIMHKLLVSRVTETYKRIDNEPTLAPLFKVQGKATESVHNEYIDIYLQLDSSTAKTGLTTLKDLRYLITIKF